MVAVPTPPEGRGGAQRIPRPASSVAGGPAPWAALSPEDRRFGPDRLRTMFDGLGPARPSARRTGMGHGAAVLAPFYEDHGELHLILTRRASGLRLHGGEVSFPGGRQDPGESLPETALREAQEEIGLDPATVEIVGELDHLSTLSSASFIVPYVAIVDRVPPLRPNPGEVDAVLRVPVAELLDPAHFREEQWWLFDQYRPIVFFELVGDTVWGATAAMLRQLLGLATATVGRGDLGHD